MPLRTEIAFDVDVINDIWPLPQKLIIIQKEYSVKEKYWDKSIVNGL